MVFFESEYKFQMHIHRYCYKNYQKIRWHCYCTTFVLFVLVFLYILTNWNFINSLMTICFLLSITQFIMLNINSVLTSLRKFLLYGSLCGLLLMLLLSTILFDVFKTYSTNITIELFVMYICKHDNSAPNHGIQ